jgi:integrase/recombinase XerD
MTDFAKAAEDYLALRRALGFKLAQPGRMLAGFAGWLHEQGAEHITVAVALEWAVLPADASRWWHQQRLGIVRGFARYLQAFDPATEIPPHGLITCPAPRVAPSEFTPAEIAALMNAAGTLAQPLRAATYRTLIGLAAVTGMRAGELVALDDADVRPEERVIVIRNGKFGNYAEGAVMPSPVTGLVACGNCAQDSSA